MANWILRQSNVCADALAAQFQVDPLLIRILSNRRISSQKSLKEFFSNDLSAVDSYEGLPDIGKFIAECTRFRDRGEKVRIIGDYDVDGVLSTVILLKGLRLFGIGADYEIPHRVIDGYGLNENLIENAFRDGIQAIITCDNGISAIDVIKKASDKGMRILVTDHHEVLKDTADGQTEILPDARAVVNPKRKASLYPMTEICGAQVAYKVICALNDWSGERILSKNEEALRRELRILAGLAALEDVMPLFSENHRWVRYAMENVKSSNNPGLLSLIKKNELMDKEIKSYHIGFILGPCINATGRLDSAKRAVELFTNDSVEACQAIADELVALNLERKEKTVEATQRAIELVLQNDCGEKVLVVYLENAHESIAGIVAGRIREHFNRPSFVFTPASEGIKGSGRSVEGYDMYSHLAMHQELYYKFGGHKMAAGLTLKEGCIEAFRDAINASCELDVKDFEPKLLIDAAPEFSYFTIPLLEQLDLLEPFGAGNESPLFAAKNVRLSSVSTFGKEGQFLKITVEQNHRFYTLKSFRLTEPFLEFLRNTFGEKVLFELKNGREIRIFVAFTVRINEFNSNRSVEFMLEDYKC